MKPLPLYPGSKPCQRTGYCCEQGPCAFGVWDAAAHRCAFLTYEGTTASCAKYDEILARPAAEWAMNPAFGAGCCSPLNPRRHREK